MSRLLAAALLLVLAALPAWALDPVTLQLNWKHQFQFAGYYAAIEKGYYREAGLDVRLIEASEGQDPIAAVLRGQAQYGVGASELALRRAKGEPVVALATILQHSPLVLLARNDAGIDSIHDLAGKRVMLMPHETELFAYLQREGVPLAALKVVHHTFDTKDLGAGRVDALSGYATDETFVLRQAGLAFSTFTPRSAGIDFYGDTLFTTEAEQQRRPERLKAFREASLRGWRYAMANPGEIADLILAKYGRRHDREHLLFEAAEMTRLMQPDLVEIGHMTAGRWRHIVDTYAELGMLAADASLDGFLHDPEPAPMPAWVMPAFVAGGLLFAAMAALAWRYLHLSRRLRLEVGDRQTAERRLQAAQRDMAALIDATPGAAMLLDREGRILAINHAGAARFQGDKERITGLNIYELSPPDVAAGRRQAADKAFRERRTLSIEDRRAGRDLRNTVVPVEDEDGEIRRIAVFSEDVTERRRAEDALRASEEKYRFLAENTADVVWQLDEQLRVIYVNAADEKLRGYPATEVIGRPITDFLMPESLDTVRQVVTERHRQEMAGVDSGTLRFEVREKCASGGSVWVEINSTPLRDATGRIVGYNGVGRDVSQRRLADEAMREAHERLQAQLREIQALQAQMADLAVHDSLTGLYNRRYLDETLERELSRARRESIPLSLVMMDLDRFKDINDSHGHKAGDEVLRALADLLRADVRAEDVSCRYGGEEFLVLLPKMPPAVAAERAERWRRAIADLAVPFGAIELRITASFGVASYPDHGATPDELTQLADEALYQAKASGRDRVVIHEPIAREALP